MQRSHMPPLSKEIAEGLQDLIEVNLDSSKGLEAAADQIENERMASYFRSLAPERKQFAEELKGFVSMMGREPKEQGTVKGALHRWWLSIHGTVRLGDEHAVLSDAEKGEDTIKERYEQVLATTTGSPLESVLREQYDRIRIDHDTIRDLRDATAS